MKSKCEKCGRELAYFAFVDFAAREVDVVGPASGFTGCEPLEPEREASWYCPACTALAGNGGWIYVAEAETAEEARRLAIDALNRWLGEDG